MEETIQTNIEEQLPLDQNNSEAEIEELNKTLETLSDAIPDDEEKTEQLLDEEIKKDLASATKELEEQEEKKDEKQDNKDDKKDEKQLNKDEKQ